MAARAVADDPECRKNGDIRVALELQASRACGACDNPHVRDLMNAVSCGPITLHAAARWARAVRKAIDAPADPRTFGQWGRQIGAAPGTIRGWCKVARVAPRNSLLLARALRGVYLAQQIGWDPGNLFDIIDQRTLNGFLARTGLTDCGAGCLPPFDRYFACQRLIQSPVLCDAIRSLCLEMVALSTADVRSNDTSDSRINTTF